MSGRLRALCRAATLVVTNFALLAAGTMVATLAEGSMDQCSLWAIYPDPIASVVHGYPLGEVNSDSVVGIMLDGSEPDCEYWWTLTVRAGDEEQAFKFTTGGYLNHVWVDAELAPNTVYFVEASHQHSVEPFQWSFSTSGGASEMIPASWAEQDMTVHVVHGRKNTGIVGWSFRSWPELRSPDRFQMLSPDGAVFSESPLIPGIPPLGARQFEVLPDIAELMCVDFRQVTPDGLLVADGEVCDPSPTSYEPGCSCASQPRMLGANGILLLGLVVWGRRRRACTGSHAVY